jgi:hypothetical protein
MFKIPCRRCALMALAVSFALAARAQEKTPAFPTNEQLRHFKGMGDPQLSPDGKQVLLRITDATTDGGKGHIWLVDVEGRAARQITYSPEGDKRGESRAQWMPDGSSVLFLAHRGEHTQLYKLPMHGGEAKAFELKVAPLVDESKREGALPPVAADAKKDESKVEPVVIDVASYRVSPDGKTIAVFARDPETPGEKKEKDAKADAEWVDHSLHGERMYLLDVATEKLTVTGVPVDVEGASWSADSTKLVAIARVRGCGRRVILRTRRRWRRFLRPWGRQYGRMMVRRLFTWRRQNRMLLRDIRTCMCWMSLARRRRI